MNPEPVHFAVMDSVIGPLLIGGAGTALDFIHLPESNRLPEPDASWIRDDSGFAEVRRQLAAYFAQELTAFSLDYELRGTEFQIAVWEQLAAIPFGETCSYGEIARRLEKPGASRAVGLANNANPLPIVVPCHRVIGADGSMVGFGGGLDAKKWLLRHEGVPLPGDPPRDQMGFSF